jgi:hypothetical protein
MRVVWVAVGEGTGKRVARQQAGILGKRDEQHAVENLLRQRDALQRCHLRMGNLHGCDQLQAQCLVVLIKPAGDVLVFAPALLQQGLRLAGQQVFGRKQQHEACVFFWLGKLLEPETSYAPVPSPKPYKRSSSMLDTSTHFTPRALVAYSHACCTGLLCVRA